MRLNVRVSPKASRNEIGEIMEDADGSFWLRVKITTAPEDGKANKALIALLSKNWKISKSQFEILSGETARKKCLLIRGLRSAPELP